MAGCVAAVAGVGAGCLGSSSSASNGDRGCAPVGCSAEDAARILDGWLKSETDVTARVSETGGFFDFGGRSSLLVEHVTSSEGDVGIAGTPPANASTGVYEDITAIANGYSGAIVDEFEIGGLDGEVVISLETDPTDVLATWHIEREWAEAYINDVWSEYRYHTEVLLTFEV